MDYSYWDNVTVKDVVNAIKLSQTSKEKYVGAKNTFVIFNGEPYPGKHIRELAFKVANNMEIQKDDFSGGIETVNFFLNLGFSVLYKNEEKRPNIATQNTINSSDRIDHISSNKKNLSVVKQKCALQLHLQKYYGYIEVEKKFDWLKTPDLSASEQVPVSKDYRKIVTALTEYRGNSGFIKKNGFALSCDIVLEEFKVIIEYDERQHFSKARSITLENYPSSVELFYSKEDWIRSCQEIAAKDNDPIDRDERRAFNDCVRDIEAAKNGYKLVRIKHEQIDWESVDAKEALKRIIPLS